MATPVNKSWNSVVVEIETQSFKFSPPPKPNRTPAASFSSNESGLHHDYEAWLEKLAPHAPTSQYHHDRRSKI
jgi:hypothetical protein